MNIDPLILFARLTALLQRDDEITDKFRYELIPEPTSLFKDCMMRKANKSVLRNFFLDKNEPVDDVQADTCIIDGGALLHKIQWEAKGTFKDVINKYINFLKRRYDTYDTVCIVFDGYVDKNSIKTQEHLRRSKSMSASITVTEHMNVTCGSQNFLRNTSNKEKLIKLLSNYMCLNGYHVVQCTGDADTSIVEKAIQYAHDGKTVVVAADDTDVLVLLIYHWHDGLGEIFFSTERKEGGKRNKLLKS